MSPHLTHTNPGAGIAASSVTKSVGLVCSHCQGHLVADLYIDRVDAGGHVWIRALRCVRCGTIDETGRAGGSHSRRIIRRGTRQGNLLKEIDDEIIVLGI